MNTENKDLKNGLDSFLGEKKQEIKKTEEKVEVIPSRSGLVERIDKTLVTSDGRQLLLEVLYQPNVL